MTIASTTNPASNISINFTISAYPAGAEGQMLTKSSETTNIQGLADVQLKLGDIPAEYGVTVICPQCVPEYSSVTFTCCGKLPNDHFSQSGVPEWSYDCYNGYTGDCGKNRTTIGWKGCALTALANLINYYARGYPELNISVTNPGMLNEYLNKNKGYDDKKDVNFKRIFEYTNGKVSYKARYDLKDSIKRNDIVNLLNNEILNKRPVIAVIKKEDGKFHYILVTGKCGDKYIISDPAGGKERLYDPNEVNYSLVGLRVFGRN